MSIQSSNISGAVIPRLTISAVVLAAASTAAIARPDVRQMSCEQARGLVYDSGSVVLTTGRYTYDKYVSGQRYCDFPFAIVRAYVSTRDDPQCPIGYRCEVQDDLNSAFGN